MRALCLAATALVAGGCGYALVGRGIAVDPSIKTIGVPLFKDATGKPGLDRKVTDQVVEELLKRGRFKVIPETVGADATLEGTLTTYRVVPVGFEEGSGDAAQTQASRYAIVLSARVAYSKVGEPKPIWSNGNFSFRDEYDLGEDPQAFFDREEQAIDRLAEQFARSLVSTMLEAF